MRLLVKSLLGLLLVLGVVCEARYTYSGAQSGVGAKMAWARQRPEVGSGWQTIIESVADQKVATELEFGEQGRPSP